MPNTNDIRLNRAYNSLQGLSVGDAFGEKFFLHPDVAQNIIASRAIPASPWYYTDDTQMSLSIYWVLREYGEIKQDELAKSFARRYRGLSSDEKKLVLHYLKSIGEEEAVEVLNYMVNQKNVISTVLAKRILRSKIHVKSFFEYGVVNSDAQSIKRWLDFAIPKLGFKSTVYLIEKLNHQSNRLIEKAAYWLRAFIYENETNS